MKTHFKLREETIKRCKVFTLDAKQRQRFVPISMELFHFLFQARAIKFTVFFRIGDRCIEFIKPNELSKRLLEEVWEAMQRPFEGLEVCILKSDRAQFELTIDAIRNEKILNLRKKMPDLDPKALNLYSHLSSASQMIISGGIDANVVAKVKASAAYLVANAMDSDNAISTLSRMITCDPTLYDHSASVAMMASVIATRLLAKPLSTKEAEIVSQGALYHDVGKTCVPNALLNKPGKYTPEEVEQIRQHTVLGYQELEKLIAAGMTIDRAAARVALEHHEKWDGEGYPYKRRGALERDAANGIHLYSRIVTIADIYSALLMKRVYKPAFRPQDAIKIMAAEAKGFDPEIFSPFLKGVVRSLNAEAKGKDQGRILRVDENGTLVEWGH